MSQLQKQWDKEFQEQMLKQYREEYIDFDLTSYKRTKWGINNEVW